MSTAYPTPSWEEMKFIFAISYAQAIQAHRNLIGTPWDRGRRASVVRDGLSPPGTF